MQPPSQTDLIQRRIDQIFPNCKEIGTTYHGVIHVRNNSDCSLHYHLWLDQSLAGSYSKHEIARDMIGICVS